jgi:acyl carrier protein
MSRPAWPELSQSDLLQLQPELREQSILQFLKDVVLALRYPPGEAPSETNRLTELGLDSLQFVELKFALDTLVGDELDIEPFAEDPCLKDLAAMANAALTDRSAASDR